jgi:hypothetical protein
MTEPTDAEIDALLRPFYESDDAAEMAKYDDRLTARAVLAKWGTPPAAVGDTVGWMWQHEETGRTGFVDCWQVENGWQENNPRLRLVSKLYTSPPAVAGEQTMADVIAACNGTEAFGLIMGLREALQGAVSMAKDAHGHWDEDRDAKVGKHLLALAGANKGYDKRADAIHAALAAQGEKP